MSNEALFLELAKALAQPSGAYKAASAALDIPGQALGGYESGAQFADKQRQRKLGQQTLAEALGGRSLEEGLPNLTAESGALQHPNLEIWAAIEKSKRDHMPKPEDYLTTDQARKSLIGIRGKASKADEAYLSSFPNGQIPRQDFTPYVTAGISQRGQNLADERGRANISLRDQGQAMAFGKAFDNDKDVVRAFTEKNQSLRAQNILASGNPVGDQSVKTIAARAAGEVGNLSAPEQAQFGGSPALTDWLNRNATRLTTGKLDETDRGYLNDLFSVYAKYADTRLNQRKQYHAARYAHVANIPIEEASQRLGDISQLGVAEDAGAESGTGMIRIKDSQGGLHDIPKANFGKAKERDPGLQVIQ